MQTTVLGGFLSIRYVYPKTPPLAGGGVFLFVVKTVVTVKNQKLRARKNPKNKLKTAINSGFQKRNGRSGGT